MEFANAALTRWSKKCNFIRKAGEWSSRFTKPLVVTYVVDNCGDQLAPRLQQRIDVRALIKSRYGSS
jgi:hypothetical protein